MLISVYSFLAPCLCDLNMIKRASKKERPPYLTVWFTEEDGTKQKTHGQTTTGTSRYIFTKVPRDCCFLISFHF